MAAKSKGGKKKDKDKGKGESKDKGKSNGDRLPKKEYEEELEKLQLELTRMARWLRHTGKRILVIVEGRDTAGKGGVISAIAGAMSPRQCRVVALPAPNDREKSQWYFQRYIQHLPAAGELVLFDRSWYNRAGVETVMGYAEPDQVLKFFEQTPSVEKHLVDDGLILFKYWLAVDQEKQEERFAERLEDPLKRWKLSPIDLKSRTKYAEYTRARERMFAATHTKTAPWTVVEFNDQRRGRLNLIRDLLDRIPDTRVPPMKLDFPKLKGKPGKEQYHVVQPIKGKY
jgi:polyphosphate kinase 2